MYFITCLENLEHDILGWMDSPRCFGYFPTYERAVEALKTNECDVWEMGIFEYAVIEKVEPGIHPHAEEMAWFKFDTDKCGFCEIPKPEETTGYNYALG
jgi:hypothetical protein